MKSIIFLSMLLTSQIFATQLNIPPVLKPDTQTINIPQQGKFIRTGPTIQIAILLDTSNSMDGLINQAKTQIWNIINEVSRANKDNKDVTMQIALFEYGKMSLPMHTGYIQMLSPLTNDLDFLSEKLFSLKTNGGDEYAGMVIDKAVKKLYWSKHKDDLKIIIIAGNEGFDQGDLNYVEAVTDAKENKILVNTIYCGEYNDGINLKWKSGADIGNGRYMNIDSDAKVRYIKTPYDGDIISLNKRLNDTYIGYGREGAMKKSRQLTQDKQNEVLSTSSYISRAVSKSTKQYKTDSWDAVASFDKGNKEITKVLKESNVEFKDKNEKEIAVIIESKSKERKEIQKEIQTLEKKRRDYIAKNSDKSDKNTFGEKIIKEMKLQIKEKGYNFKK